MLAKADRGLFRASRLLTLTVDRKRFATSQAAHQYVTAGGFIPRLMRLLGVTVWLWVLEFQTATGDGWPHWHVLLDVRELPGWRIDLERAWGLWRDKWRIGGLDLGRLGTKATGAKHALMYLTKYVTKMPPAFPLWVIESEKGIRFVGGSRAVGSLTNQPPRPESDVGEAPEEPAGLEPADPQMLLPLRMPRMTFLAAMARCEMRCNVFHVEGDPVTGDGGWSFARRLNAVPADLVDMSEAGKLSMRMSPVSWGEKELLAITPGKCLGVVAAINRLDDELQDAGCRQRWRDDVNNREFLIAAEHAAFWLHKSWAASSAVAMLN